MKFLRKNWPHFLIWGVMLLYVLISPRLEVKYFINQGKPVQVNDVSFDSTDLVYFGVDENKLVTLEGENLNKVTGWSFLSTATDLADYDIYFVLDSPERKYLFTTTAVGRRDIRRIYREMKMDLRNCGFTTFIAKETLAVGEYGVGFLYRHKTNGEVVYTLTDRQMIRTPNTLQLVELEEQE